MVARGDRGASSGSMPTPRSRSSSSPAAAATSRTCSGSATSALVRAAPRHPRPSSSAIGHEADRPLLDEVADLRASTPTDAAKRVVPDVAEELVRVEQARARLRMRLTRMLTHEIDRIGQLRSRPALADPSGSSTAAPRTSPGGSRAAPSSWSAASSAPTARVAELRAQLRALSPQAHARPRLRDRAARRRPGAARDRPGAPEGTAPHARRSPRARSGPVRRAVARRRCRRRRIEWRACPPPRMSPTSATSRRATSSCGSSPSSSRGPPPSSSRSRCGSAARRSPHAARSG